MQTESFENARWERGEQSSEFRHGAAVALLRGGSVLDVGCGDGLFLSLITDPHIEKYGVDVSPVAIHRLHARGISGEVCDAGSENLPFPDGKFTTVVALDVLEHLFVPEKLLQEALRVATDSVILGVPNFNSLPARIGVLFGRVPENNRPKKGHCYWFNLKVLRSMITDCGGEIVEIRSNTFWEESSIFGPVLRFFARRFPSLFALSFVVLVKKSATHG